MFQQQHPAVPGNEHMLSWLWLSKGCTAPCGHAWARTASMTGQAQLRAGTALLQMLLLDPSQAQHSQPRTARPDQLPSAEQCRAVQDGAGMHTARQPPSTAHLRLTATASVSLPPCQANMLAPRVRPACPLSRMPGRTKAFTPSSARRGAWAGRHCTAWRGKQGQLGERKCASNMPPGCSAELDDAAASVNGSHLFTASKCWRQLNQQAMQCTPWRGTACAACVAHLPGTAASTARWQLQAASPCLWRTCAAIAPLPTALAAQAAAAAPAAAAGRLAAALLLAPPHWRPCPRRWCPGAHCRCCCRCLLR